MKKKKKKYNGTKVACKIDREREIATHGKIVSLRPTRVHKSIKYYNRQENKRIENNFE